MAIKIEGDPNDKYELPAELLSEEKLKLAELEQKQLAERINSPYANKSPQDIQRFNASIIVAETEAMLDVLPINALGETAREIYAEALAENGHFEKAAEATASPEKSELYLGVAEAIAKPDSEKCGCKMEKVGDRYINNLHVEAEVFSHLHGRRMPIVRCNICGHRNVKGLPDSIAKERALRAKVMSYTSGMTHADAKLTMDKLLK